MLIWRSCIRRACASLVTYRKPVSPLLIRPTHRFTSSFDALDNATKTYDESGVYKEPDSAEQGIEAQDTLDETQKKKLKWIVKKRLTYLKDPVRIAEDVQRTLEKDKFDEALELTREACRNTDVVVSWNHLIDYQFKHNRMRAAFKLFNEVSSRHVPRRPATLLPYFHD